MHEYSIARSLLRRVEQEAQSHRASAVRRVRVRVGELAGVEIALLESAFALLRRGTCCAGSELEVVPEKVGWRCADCGREVPPSGALRCKNCDSPAVLAAGGEILLEGIDLEMSHV